MSDDREALKNFMGGYFHEDWSDVDTSPEAAVQHYFRDQGSTEELSSVLRALRELIEGDAGDEALSDRLFDEYGCNFYPPGAGLSTRAWVRTLADDFEREIKARE
jgi:hypothetical protein